MKSNSEWALEKLGTRPINFEIDPIQSKSGHC